MSASCLFPGTVYTDPSVCANRLHQLLPAGPTTLEVFYPGCMLVPWALAGIPDRTTTLSFNVHCETGGVAQYHTVKCMSPALLASTIGNPVPLVSNSRTYRSMYNNYVRMQAPEYMTTGSVTGAMNTFLVNWNTSTGFPGDYVPAAVNQTAADAAQVVMASQASSGMFNVMKDLYMDVLATLTAGQYAFVDISGPLCYAYNEFSIWAPQLMATPANWIFRCNGEPDILSVFQGNPAYTIETLSDGVSTLIRNF